MSFEEKLDQLLYEIGKSKADPLEKFRAEINFAKRFAEALSQKKWEDLILKAAGVVSKGLSTEKVVDVEKLVSEAEAVLAPIGKTAKQYTIHCRGHAHIDMNWMWPWPETVSVAHDTFYTVDKLMDEFPDFLFSQSQVSTYIAMEEYCPEIFEKIKKRVKEGKWEITASMWVEGDKNIISGESICRHLLYTRQYLKEKFGFEPEDVKIDWSPDTFGHAYTIPSILNKGGVDRYYFHRTGPDKWLFKWRSPDGSEVYAFKDRDKYVYNGPIDPIDMGEVLSDYVKETGLKDFMYTFGVGDHGGGPTRKDLRKAQEIAKWPIFPTVKFSSTHAFFDAVEKANPKLPVFDGDMNYIFEGCYTSQSNIKRATRVSEIILPEMETLAVIAGAVDGMDYPSDIAQKGWRYALFNHFHDILPGSGIHATYEYSQGLFQEIQAIAGSTKIRALRRLASKVDTESVVKLKPSKLGEGMGDGFAAGAGSYYFPGSLTTANMGAADAEPVLIYNPKPWARSETAYAYVWNKPLDAERVVVRDSSGKEIKGQVIETGSIWAHNFTKVAFKADVPALGYKVYAIDESVLPVECDGARLSGPADFYGIQLSGAADSRVLENEYLEVDVEHRSGAIRHLIDKKTGYDFVPEGKLLGLIEAYQEDPHPMTSWFIGQFSECHPFTQGGKLTVKQRGPNRVAVSTEFKYRDSKILVEIGLNAGSRMVDFKVNMRWVEIGTPETGVPMLKVAFPLNTKPGVATYEIPFGSQTRPQSLQEIPALKWADVSGEIDKGEAGITLVNDSKYGHSCQDNTLRLSLIRSSYEPDPMPEVADHEIKFGVLAHMGGCDVIEATKLGEEFNSPLTVVSAPVQKGSLPAEKSFVEVLTPNVFVSTIKKAEDSDALVIRMFETTGKKTTAKVKINGLIKKGAKAIETDILERPVKNTAKLSGDTLTVTVPAYSQSTVKIG